PQVRAWCRAEGHDVDIVVGERDASTDVRPPRVAVIRPTALAMGRWHGAERAGEADPRAPGAVHAHPPGRWGLAARGALVEAGAPAFEFALSDRDAVWADDAARLY